MNPKIIALLQTLFYGFVTVATPIFITSLGAGGALNGLLPAGATAALLFVLNLVDNQMNATTGGNFFGSLS